jgi:hypothetical protein
MARTSTAMTINHLLQRQLHPPAAAMRAGCAREDDVGSSQLFGPKLTAFRREKNS